ncbi:hypothetical protein [Methanobrevibacter sp. DSM 116169]|uniref:hypothetical protein n=1 Tax=Methanobrevibacter sp. DSM 116169 TaxID=3242727 RepID=UPI0038FC3164
MSFVPPSWFDGLLWFMGHEILVLILLCVLGLIIVGLISQISEDGGAVVGMVLIIVILVATPVVTSYWWYSDYEVPSVQEKVITVQEWQPRPGISTNDMGMMVVDNADDLMLVTSEGEGFYNTENFFFRKFETRDILSELKEGGTYKIKYYGWREGFNSGFPNLLEVTEVVDETNVTNKTVSDYFGTQLTA